MAEETIEGIVIPITIEIKINDPNILTKPFEPIDNPKSIDEIISNTGINTNTENLKIIGALLSTGFESLITAFHNSLLSDKLITEIRLNESNLDVDITFTLADKDGT